MTTRPRRLRRVSIVVLLALALHPTGDAQAPGEAREPLPAAAPASVGFSEERLTRLDARMKRFVDEGQHAGIVMLLARKGRVVEWRTWGQRDVARQLPMEKDTIFRIYSMSKIITSVAVMALHEEGRIKLDDPVTKYLPALKACEGVQGRDRRRSGCRARPHADHHQTPAHAHVRFHLRIRKRTSGQDLQQLGRLRGHIDGRVRGAGGQTSSGARAG